MLTLTRRRQLIIAALVGLVLVVGAVVFFASAEDLKSKLTRVAVGMHREQVVGLLGRPALDMERTEGRGTALVWVDQLWQVDVITGPDGRVQYTTCVPSDSPTRQILGRLGSLLK